MSSNIAPEKNETAKVLTNAHLQFDPAITLIFRVTSDREQDANEPIKLLEVNPDTSPSGILPIAFSADPPSVPFPSVVIEVTEGEFKQIKDGSLKLPNGWQVGEVLYKRAA